MVYIDTIYQGNCFNGPINSSTMPLIVGAFKDKSNSFKGKVDELKVYDRAISNFEILLLYNQGEIHPLNTLEDLTIGYFKSAVLDAGEGFDTYAWSNGKTTQVNIFENITSSIHNISVFAVNEEGCFSDTLSINLASTAIKTLNGEGYKIWPCPATTYINISFDMKIPSKIELLNMQGQILNTLYQCHDFSRFDIGGLSTGYYLIRIYFSDIVLTEKVIVN